MRANAHEGSNPSLSARKEEQEDESEGRDDPAYEQTYMTAWERAEVWASPGE